MSSPFLGEIRMAGFNFAPVGWAFASGQQLSIAQNSALYNLIGTIYGGDGVNTFALPAVQSRMPMHMGNGAGLSVRILGQTGGAEAITFRDAYIPSAPQPPIPTLASATAARGSDSPLVVIHRPEQRTTISPFLVLNFIIALQGIYPSQS
jgi:microcystin-dependent protein